MILPTRSEPGLDGARRFLTRFAGACLWFGLGAGLLGALLYTPAQPYLEIWGMSLRSVRPLHITAGTAWIYLAGLAVVVHYWAGPGLSAVASRRGAGPVRRAIWFLLVSWAVGAVVVLVTLVSGAYAGREYFFVSVPASTLFWVGWLPVAWVFLRTGAGGETFQGQPVYRWMWMTSFGLFTYAFVETHLFLLPYFQAHPLRDMAIEWKSYGTLVGSFNLLVYGALAYLGHRLGGGGPGGYARSRTAFALFWVGVLNSFTNYGHHTYHLPQTPVLKWISFLVSMSEVAILVKVVWDVWGLARRYQRTRGRAWDLVTWLLASTTWWTCVSLVLSILLSVPPLNSLVHGTLVVAGHAMGSMLGIDTLGLIAVLTWAHVRDREAAAQGGAARGLPRWPVVPLNAGILVVWSAFMTVGLSDGLHRWQAGLLPSQSVWPAWFGFAFIGGGLLVAAGVVALTWRWMLPHWLVEELAGAPAP